MSTQEEEARGVILPEGTVREIYQKLNTVEASVGDVRTNIGGLKVMLEHINEDFDRLETVLNQLERILYGKGEASAVGLLTRLIQLEKSEERRQAMFWWIGTAVGGLVLKAVFELITGFKSP